MFQWVEHVCTAVIVHFNLMVAVLLQWNMNILLSTEHLTFPLTSEFDGFSQWNYLNLIQTLFINVRYKNQICITQIKEKFNVYLFFICLWVRVSTIHHGVHFSIFPPTAPNPALFLFHFQWLISRVVSDCLMTTDGFFSGGHSLSAQRKESI